MPGPDDDADAAGVTPAVEAELVAALPPPAAEPTLAHLRQPPRRGPKWYLETPRNEAEELRWQIACQLELVGHKLPQIAKIVGRSEARLDRVLRSAWAEDYKTTILPEIRTRILQNTTDAATQFMLAAPRMATVMITAAEDEPSPFRKALIAEKNLALAGVKPPPDTADDEGDPRRKAVKGLTDAELVGFLERDEVPDSVRAAFAIDVTPPADDE